MPDLTPFLLMAALVAFLIGLSKGGLGGTLGALATPLMALVMPADRVIGLLLPVLMYADLFAVALHWRRWDRRIILLLVPASLIGVIAGAIFLSRVSPNTLKLVLGVITLIFAGYKLFESRIHRSVNYQPRAWHGYVAGSVAGFSSTLAHNGGPPASIYLLLQGITPRTFIATSALFFMILNWLKVPFYWRSGLFDLALLRGIALPMLVLVPIGVWVGRWIGLRLNKRTFEQVIVVLLFLSGILLIYQVTTAAPQQPPASAFAGPVPPQAAQRLGKGAIRSVAVSPDGTRLAVGSDTALHLYDAATLSELWVAPAFAPVLAVRFSEDGALIRAEPKEAAAQVFTTATGTEATAAAGTIWAQPGRPPAEGEALPAGFTPLGWQVGSVDWSPDGSVLASGVGPEVWLWDREDAAPRRLTGHTRQVSALAWSPDGARLASGSRDNTIILWNPSTGERLQALDGHKDGIWGLVWSPDGKRLASTGSLDNQLIVWDVASGSPAFSLIGPDQGLWGLAWSPDGKTLAAGSTRGEIVLWDMSGATPTQPSGSLLGHLAWVSSLDWSPDGKRLASGSADQLVIVWDVAQNQRLQSLAGHTAPVRAVTFSPDGNRLATAGIDREVLVWPSDSAADRTAQPLATLRGHSAGVLDLSWSPQRDQLASGSEDGSVILWNIDPIANP